MDKHSICNFFITGEQGMGLASAGDVIIDALSHMGYRSRVDREFNSLIKFGKTKVSIRFGTNPVHGASINYNFGVGVGKSGLITASKQAQDGTILLHNFERWQEPFPHLEEDMKKRNIQLIYIPTRELIHDMNIHHLFENTFIIGSIAHILGISFEDIKHALHKRYGKKEKLRKANLGCLRRGYDLIEQVLISIDKPTNPSVKGEDNDEVVSREFSTNKSTEEVGKLLLDGNTALALGALHAGVRCYYAYPMSPSTSILSYLAKTADQTGLTIKQAEDEITAIQLTLGSMYAGARALTATSGGGFDLMTETISLSGITEVPLVCVIVQRPGPGTGLPTWTAQGDLNLAIHAGHGEFSRIVLAVSDQLSAFELTQHAFNLAEQFQIPVIILSEKVIAESRRMIPEFTQGTIPITRYLVTEKQELENLESTDRYKLTDSGVSKRRIPGSSETIFFCNGDEHKEDGTLDESPATEHMIMKRIKKQTAILEALPDPVLYGNTTASTSFIGRGSSKNAIRDCIATGADINYLHFDYVYPLKTTKLKEFIEANTHVCIVENNATGQLHQLMKREGITIDHELLKRNGRPFFIEDIQEYITQHVQ